MSEKEDIHIPDDSSDLLALIKACEDVYADEKKPLLFAIAKWMEISFELKEAYLKGYRDGIIYLKHNN